MKYLKTNTTKRNLFAFSNINENGAVKIGHNDTKYHSALIDPKYGLMILCGCANTKQKSTCNKTIFIKDIKGNCGN